MAFLVKDYTVKQMCKQIAKQYMEKFGKPITEDEVYEIVNSQFTNMPKYMEREETVKFDYLGKFLVKEGRKDALLKNEEFAKHYNEVNERKPLIPKIKLKSKQNVGTTDT